MHTWRVSIGITQKLNGDQTNYELLRHVLRNSLDIAATDPTATSGRENIDAKDNSNISPNNGANDRHRRAFTRTGWSH